MPINQLKLICDDFTTLKNWLSEIIGPIKLERSTFFCDTTYGEGWDLQFNFNPNSIGFVDNMALLYLFTPFTTEQQTMFVLTFGGK